MATLAAVAGSVDGVQPIYQPNERWCWWELNEIFRGTTGTNKYIPKVNDYVMDSKTFTTYIVDELDPVTYIPTLREIKPANMDFSLTETDILFGVGPGTQADTYRVYLDTTVMPYRMCVDTRLRVGGSKTSYCKLFLGSTLDNTGEVISKMYDSNGVFISENVPLELAAIDSHTNYSIRVVEEFRCTKKLKDGEVVTAVFYSNTGIVVSKRQLLVENTNFIRSLNVTKKYVTGISLESPFLSPTIENQIDYPLNVPMNALNLMGVVSYSDGTTMRAPVDGTKFAMYGLEQYVSSIIGQKVNLVLRYVLGAGESAYAGVGVDGHFITEPYVLKNVNPNNSYSVKLFGYPFWVNDATGYQMRWWLFNLDRNIWFDVTQQVTYSASSGAFDPKAYGVLQRKTVSLNLRTVSNAFKAFVHVQQVEITLLNPPDAEHTPWLVSHESNTIRPAYGQDLFAKRKSATAVNLSSKITDFNEWLNRVYLHTYPLVNPATETSAITPTHFLVDYAGKVTEYPITDWNKDLNIGTGIVSKRTVSIRFVKRAVNGDLQLSIAAMIIGD